MRVRVTAIRNMALRRLAIAASIVPLFVVTFPLTLLSNILVLGQSAYIAWTQREERPEQCEVGRVGTALVIRMPFSLLAHAAKFAPCVVHHEPGQCCSAASPCNHQKAHGPHSLCAVCDDGFRVTDPKLFAESVHRALTRETDESGATLVHEMFDDAIEKVIDDGGEGFAWPALGIK